MAARALLCIILLGPLPAAFALWPAPTVFKKGKTAVRLAPSFSVKLSMSNPPQDLVDAAARTEFHIANDNHRLMDIGRGKAHTEAIARAPQLPHLNVQIMGHVAARPIAEEATAHFEERDESYYLTIPDDGREATLRANGSLGILRGLTTFEQIWYTLGYTKETHIQIHTAPAYRYTLEAPIEIDDSPAFPYRGLMLDTARNFYSVDDLKRTFDAMSMVKMNAFHWHVTDSQSFPVEVEDYPELARKGAYDEELVYTTADIQDLGQYAAVRGIDIIMEIDSPGHSGAVHKAYPEHIACPESRPWGSYAAEPPSGQLRIASPKTVDFTARMFSALASKLPGKYFSSGGDEVNYNCYSTDDQTQNDLKKSGKTLEEALDNFTQKTHQALIKQGKTPVVWEEMALNHNVTLNKSTVVTCWISSGTVAAVTAKGYRVVQAPSDYFYLDCGAGMWLGSSIGGSWCDPFKSWQRIYSFSPFSGIPGGQRSLILGGQTLLWSEQSDPANLDPIVWPRTAALAEVYWSPEDHRRNTSDALVRLHDIRYRMVQRGIRAIALQPHWCAVRPGLCDSGA